jgi:transposase-like protein
MPKPLDDTKRAAILADIKAGSKSRNQIARDHGVSPSTVTGVAKAEGITGAFDRSQTKEATQAREADCKALRAELKVDLLHDAQRLRKRIWGSHQVVVSTPQGAEVVTLDENPLTEIRSGYTALGIAVDKSIRLEEFDSDDTDGSKNARSLLGNLFAGLSDAMAVPPAPEG